MYMLDTDTCIYILKNRSDKLRHKFNAIKNIGISSITYGELCYGIENGEPSLKKERRNQLNMFTQRLYIEPWDESVGQPYGLIRTHLSREGNLIGNNDLLIAAHAFSLGAVLVTNNVREFGRVPDLTVENWLE
ncbi:MAG: VapC toxin protein [uncultured Thiotrichaceae bacterium]|uniref:VapC toxin protein n=1 Tax=uncultured Thiotrichaceae bacterium TaxID=298394 RepID=A0A6S6TK68_9GAMM|nr:MAG: VapC toxin protein [uncultured Thiotrichaceae bacterium]